MRAAKREKLIKRLMESTDSTKTQVIDAALLFYEWGMKESNKDRGIASVYGEPNLLGGGIEFGSEWDFEEQKGG